MGKGLKVLMISSDRKILEEGSAVSERMKEYGELVEELHIVVLCEKSNTSLLKTENDKLKIAEGVYVYPTNSKNKFHRISDAVRIGRGIEVDLITTQDPFVCGLASIKLKKIKKIPLEVQIHTDIGAQDFLRRFIAKRVLASADGVRDVKDLPIYVDKEKYQNIVHAPSGKFTILCVGRLSPEKNFSLALDIFKEVYAKFPNTKLVLVGSGPEEEKLKLQAKSLKLQAHVEFAGWQENLLPFYGMADLFLQTSNFEGYGLALVEAGLAGVPIVTTKVGVAKGLENGRDALILQVGDKEEFVRAIIDLVEHNRTREELKSGIRQTLENKVLSKVDYMAKIKDNWEKTAKVVKKS